MAGYSSDTAPSAFVEVAELVFPLVFSFGSAWRIGLNGARFVPLGAFTAGLFAGPVHVACDPGAELVQVDLTPCGAAQIFGGAAAELSGQVMPLEDIPPFAGRIHDLLEALYFAKTWDMRFDIVEAFLQPLFVHSTSAQLARVWQLLARGVSVAQAAEDVGWSTRYLSTQFRRETGLRPVTAGRILRFHKALRLAEHGDPWAEVAIDAGYCDQSHLIRDFRDFAGATPKGLTQTELPRPRQVV